MSDTGAVIAARALAEELLQVQVGNRANRCPVKSALNMLEDDEAAAFEAAMEMEDIHHLTITKVLRNRGFVMGDKAVSKHRRGICSCYRESMNV